jgi:hypothetical protein
MKKKKKKKKKKTGIGYGCSNHSSRETNQQELRR